MLVVQVRKGYPLTAMRDGVVNFKQLMSYPAAAVRGRGRREGALVICDVTIATYVGEMGSHLAMD